MREVLKFKVGEEFHRSRLDLFLFDQIRELSKINITNAVKNNFCRVNNEVKNQGFKLKTGDFVEIEIDLDAVTAMLPENIPLEIIFEDKDLIIVNKAAGMIVHPTKGVKKGTLLNALTYYLNHSENKSKNFIRPGLIHRLDKKTSGLIVVSKNQKSHSVLSNHFQHKKVSKKYYAVVEGIVEVDSGKINVNIAKDSEERFWYFSETEGKKAETNFRVIQRFSDSTLLELEPVTGRTNQLRLHCQSIGHSIIGDDLYNGKEFPRLCLHAYKITFHHPIEKIEMTFETSLPEDFYGF